MVDWAALTAPFDSTQVRQRPGPGGRTLSYVDARVVAQRLDDVLTPEGWTFESEVVLLPHATHEETASTLLRDGDDVSTTSKTTRSVDLAVRGSLYIMTEKRTLIRQDHGYPNSDHDEEPIKAATSDALKRCAVLFGIGRHLYDDNTTGRPAAPRPAAAPAGRAPARPAARPPDDDLIADLGPEDGLLPFAPIAIARPGDMCAEHGVQWRGDLGDLYHPQEGVGYHRHEGNTARKRRS